MRWLNALIVRFSSSASLFSLAIVVAFGSLFAVFGPIRKAFSELTGGEVPFDFQNSLTTAQVFEQLPSYTENAKQLYYAFSFVDYFFPFFAGMFLAAIAAFSLRHLSPRAYAWADGRSLFPLLMIGTGFDWLENVFALTVISAYPEEMVTAASLMVLAKKGKLAFVVLSQAIGWGLLLLAALAWIGRRLGLLRSTA
jgi:hypothetical protein